MDKQEEWARDLEYERAEGKAEGRAEGIVQSLKSLDVPKDTILKQLQDQLNVSFEEAKELFNKYAK